MYNKTPVKVIVYFNDGYFYPVRFSYDGIKIIINTIVSNWKERNGTSGETYKFSVMTEVGPYLLEYEKRGNRWFCYKPGGW